MPLTAHCHSLRPDKSSGWLAFFELGEEGPRAGQFLVVGPEQLDRADSVQAALRAGQAAVRYLKEVPSHAPPVTLLESVSRILLHESAKTGTSLEFGCAVLEENALWFMSRGAVRLVPLGTQAAQPLASERPHAVSVAHEDRFFLGRLPHGTTDSDPDLRYRLEQGSGGDGGLILQMVTREDFPRPPRKTRAKSASRKDDRQLEFETVIHDLKKEFPQSEEPEPAFETPVFEDHQPTVSATPKTESLSESKPTPEPEPELKSEREPESGSESSAPTSAPEPAPSDPPPPPAPGPPEPVPETEAEPITADASSTSPEGLPLSAEWSTTGEAPPPEKFIPVPTRLSTAEEPPPVPVPYAPEETRGLTFWLSIVAAGLAFGALATYLVVIRPQMDRSGSPAAVDPVMKAAVFPDSVAVGFENEKLWEDQFTQAVTSTPLVAEDKVIFGCRDGRVYALSRTDGRRVWAYAATQGFGSSPARAGEMVVIGGYDGRLYALDVHSGEERWSFETQGRIVGSPTVEGGTAFVGSYDHSLYALSLRDGSVVWSRDLGSVLWSSPVCSDGMVWAAALDGGLTALTTKNGRVRWRAETGRAIYSSPALSETMVFVGSQDGYLYAFDRETGALQWKVSGNGGEMNGSPAYHEGRVIVGTDDGAVICVDAESGNLLWSLSTGGQIKSRPSFLGPLVWITGYDGFLHGINWNTGAETAKIRTDSSAFSSPTIHESVVFFGALDGRFFAISLKPTSS